MPLSMKILSIDTSCDDTSIAVVEVENKRFKILSNIISSQVELHTKYGGVYPTLAKREHQKNLVPVLKKALKQAGLLNLKFKVQSSKLQSKVKSLEKILEREEILRPELVKFLGKYQKPKIDAIAVTAGPGLEPCLWVGVNFARALALWWDLPIIPVNHLEAHILANFVNEKSWQRSDLSKKEKNIIKAKRGLTFPAVGLVVSGGNTQLLLIKDIGKYKLLGETRDDAAGECFDKTARILGLGYPGGPAIAAQAAKFSIFNFQFSNKIKIQLPRPMINSQNYDFSFSGLKTAVLYDYKKRRKAVRESEEYKIATAREIQQAVIDVLLKKTSRAAKDFKAKTIILGGGVAANNELQKQFKVYCLKSTVDFWVPPKNLCTDNAAMVGITAIFHFQNQKKWDKIKPNANLII